MLNNFIYAQSKAMFEERLHEVPNDAIVFIEDTREIWTHGHYFDCSTLDPSIIPNLQSAVAQMQSTKVEQSQLNNYVPLDRYGSTVQELWNNISELGNIKADKATTIAGYGIADAYTKTESDARFTMLPITHSELVTLRDNGQLIPGQQYRITDYVTTTAQENTKSAGHQFDIIVTADSENTLNEKARAIQHEGDTYFANANLKAWEIWYCLDNNSTRYIWAVTPINAVETLLETIKPASGVNVSGTYTYDVPISKIVFNSATYNLEIGVRTMINGGPPVHVTKTDEYTLVIEEVSTGYIASGSGISIYGIPVGKGVIYRIIDERGNDCPYDFKNIMFKHPKDTTTYPDYYYTFTLLNSGVVSDHSLNNSYCYNNVIKERIVLIAAGKNGNSLNKNVFINATSKSYCNNNSFGNDCENNTFGGNCKNNSFGNTCYSNTFGNNCNNNSFGNECYSNTFGDYCDNNTFGTNCYSNIFGDSCTNNTFENNAFSNKIGNNFKDSFFGNDCSNNKFTTTSAGSTLRNNLQHIHLDSGVVSMMMYCDGATLLKNIHVSSGVTGSVNVTVTNSARQINVYRINYSSSAGVNAVDYGEWYKHVTTSGNINVYDRHIICDNTSAITLTLPTGFPGAEFYLHKRAAQSVSVTLTSTGGQYISEGHSAKNTETRATSVTMTSLGTSKVIWDPSASEWLRIYMG